jgi:hypothetical protein
MDFPQHRLRTLPKTEISRLGKMDSLPAERHAARLPHAPSSGYDPRSMPSTTAILLLSLERITHEIREMLSAIDASDSVASPAARHELRRRIFGMRTEAQELMEWLAEVRLEEASH